MLCESLPLSNNRNQEQNSVDSTLDSAESLSFFFRKHKLRLSVMAYSYNSSTRSRKIEIPRSAGAT